MACEKPQRHLHALQYRGHPPMMPLDELKEVENVAYGEGLCGAKDCRELLPARPARLRPLLERALPLWSPWPSGAGELSLADVDITGEVCWLSVPLRIGL